MRPLSLLHFPSPLRFFFQSDAASRSCALKMHCVQAPFSQKEDFELPASSVPPLLEIEDRGMLMGGNLILKKKPFRRLMIRAVSLRSWVISPPPSFTLPFPLPHFPIVSFYSSADLVEVDQDVIHGHLQQTRRVELIPLFRQIFPSVEIGIPSLLLPTLPPFSRLFFAYVLDLEAKLTAPTSVDFQPIPLQNPLPPSYGPQLHLVFFYSFLLLFWLFK